MITSYSQLPVGLYYDIEAISRDEAREEIDKQVAILALLSGKTERDILNLPIADYRDMVAQADFISQPAPEQGRPLARYTLGTLDVVPVTDAMKFTTAQYIDFQAFSKKEDNLVEMLSVLLIPAGKTYGDGYDVRDVQTAIREHLPISDALDLYAFFFSSWLKSTQATLRSLEKDIRRTRVIRDPKTRAAKLAEIQRLKTLLRNPSTTAGAGSTR